MDQQWEQDPAILMTWLNIKEASQSYGVSIYQIRRWLLAGAIPAGRLPTPTGWVWRIRPHDPAAPVTSAVVQSPSVAPSDIETALADAEAGIARLRVLLHAYERQIAPHSAAPLEPPDDAGG